MQHQANTQISSTKEDFSKSGFNTGKRQGFALRELRTLLRDIDFEDSDRKIRRSLQSAHSKFRDALDALKEAA